MHIHPLIHLCFFNYCSRFLGYTRIKSTIVSTSFFLCCIPFSIDLLHIVRRAHFARSLYTNLGRRVLKQFKTHYFLHEPQQYLANLCAAPDELYFSERSETTPSHNISDVRFQLLHVLYRVTRVLLEWLNGVSYAESHNRYVAMRKII